VARAHAFATSWKYGDVVREMKEVEPLARERHAWFVLRKLRVRWAVPAHCEMILLQGYHLKLCEIGGAAVPLI